MSDTPHTLSDTSAESAVCRLTATQNRKKLSVGLPVCRPTCLQAYLWRVLHSCLGVFFRFSPPKPGLPQSSNFSWIFLSIIYCGWSVTTRLWSKRALCKCTGRLKSIFSAEGEAEINSEKVGQEWLMWCRPKATLKKNPAVLYDISLLMVINTKVSHAWHCEPNLAMFRFHLPTLHHLESESFEGWPHLVLYSIVKSC